MPWSVRNKDSEWFYSGRKGHIRQVCFKKTRGTERRTVHQRGVRKREVNTIEGMDVSSDAKDSRKNKNNEKKWSGNGSSADNHH